MYLKEIETFGFKSFADKMNFEFTNNINGIVGPNGSGKSNVVDAVRWVLGEASNKQLRASDTASVIFSGSKSRKPLNSAMVNIIFDNTDRHLPIDYNEVSIKRALYRTGENIYYLNGEKCRLKDITELLTDSGAAKESFNIIGQGKIDEILSTKPYDRRVIFEEAAGVLKYKKRKEEAIRKLDRTNNNINRVNDIIKELETNLEPLENQSNVAKKYLEIKDKLTDYDISLMIYDLDNYSNELNLNKEKITSLTDEITKLNANSSSYDISILSEKEKLNNLDEKLNDYHKEVLELTKKMEETSSDLKLLKERQKYLNKDEDVNKINSLKENILNKNNELNKIENEISLIKEKISLRETEIIESTTKYNEIKNNLNYHNTKIENNNREITNLNYQIDSLIDRINNGASMPTGIRNLLNNPLFSVHGTVGSLIKVPDEYAIAVSTSLGAASNYLVVDDKSLASKMVKYLKDNKLGRATFYPLDVIKGRYIDNESLTKLRKENSFIGILDEMVTYDEKYTEVIKNLLGNVILTDNINNANKLSEVTNHKYKVVTLDGNVVNVGGSITGGEQLKTSDMIKEKYDLSELKNKLKVLLNQNEDYMSQIDEYNKRLTIYEDKIYSSRLDKQTLEEDIKNKEENKYHITNEVNMLSKELKDIESITNNTTEDEESRLNKEYYDIKTQIDNLNKEIDLVNIDRTKTNNSIIELENTSRNSTLNISKLEKSLKDIELKNTRLEVKIDTLLNSLNEDYQITYNEAKTKYILSSAPNEVRKEVNELKNTIKDFGMVNLGAIEEYDRIKTRYDFLTKQKDDLNKAEETLLDIIKDMDNIMKDKFVNTFNEIRQEFKKVFKELFHGGDADIYMTNLEDVLETGIELEATPPGKSLKSVSALSGGERTFTAISLLFAILNVRPVPFCLFDEVEAALDEANVDAFGEYLSRYRNKTQFIIITHKKRTMEYVDTLYGITMQESGVSKRVSVKLGDIKK